MEQKAEVTKYIGIWLSRTMDCGATYNAPIRMPCGFIVIPPESGWVKYVDIKCPCGDERHMIIEWHS